MTGIPISVRFQDTEGLSAALSDLHRLGGVHCSEAFSAASAHSTLHLTVRPADASMARAIVRRAGGEIVT